MLQNITTRLIPLTILAFLFAFLGLSAATVSAQTARPQQGVCEGVRDLKITTGTPSANACEDRGNADADGLNDLLAKAINIFSVIVGIIAVIMIIWGGLKFITSGGDSGRITSAKQTILYAILGLIIVALAQFFVRFVLSTATQTAS